MDVDVECYGNTCTIIHGNTVTTVSRDDLKDVLRKYAESIVLDELTSDEIVSMSKQEFERRVRAVYNKLMAKVNRQPMTA